MNTTQQTTNHTTKNDRRVLRAIVATAVVVPLGAVPAAARQDPGPANPQTAYPYFCAIQRVGTQYVACDNLTGNGVPAPAWVMER